MNRLYSLEIMAKTLGNIYLPIPIPKCDNGYIVELWFAMHGSSDQNLRVFPTTCYLDDSGLSGETAIVGGCVLNGKAFRRIDDRWKRLISRSKIDAIHMADFVRPHGKNVGMYPEFKLNLFTNIAKVIRQTVL